MSFDSGHDQALQDLASNVPELHIAIHTASFGPGVVSSITRYHKNLIEIVATIET